MGMPGILMEKEWKRHY